MNNAPEVSQSNPNVTPDTPEQMLGKAYSLNELSGLRGTQDALMHDFIKDPNESDNEARVRLERQIDMDLADYLVGHGVDIQSTDFTSHFAKLRDFSSDKMSDGEWYSGVYDQTSESMQPSGRDRVRQAQIEVFGGILSVDGELPVAKKSDDSDPAEPDTEPFNTMRLDAARDRLAAVGAKRERSMVTRSGGKTRAEYDAALAEYNVAVNELGRAELDDFLDANPDATEQEKHVWFVEFIKQQQVATREAKMAKLENSAAGKFVKWFTTGSGKTRFLKAAGVGLAVGVGASLVGAAAGAVGAGAALTAGVAGAAAVTGRAMKYFAVKRGKAEGAASAQVDHIDVNQVVQDSQLAIIGGDDELDVLTRKTNDILNRDIEKVQRKARKDALLAGAVAVGTMLGGSWAAHLVLDHTGVGDAIHDVVPWNGDESVATKPGVSDSGSDVVPDVDPVVPDSGNMALTPPADLKVLPVVDELPGENVFSDAAMNIASGEGWYQTFQDMHIPQSEWGNLLNQAGPQLRDMGVAYPMGGSWGISYPGQMPKEALDLIQSLRG